MDKVEKLGVGRITENKKLNREESVEIWRDVEKLWQLCRGGGRRGDHLDESWGSPPQETLATACTDCIPREAKRNTTLACMEERGERLSLDVGDWNVQRTMPGSIEYQRERRVSTLNLVVSVDSQTVSWHSSRG